jgi:glucokinase
MTAHVLAGDIGGTRARFALFGAGGAGRFEQEVLPSREYRTFEGALDAFLRGRAKKPNIVAATFGIAGPVVDQKVKTTNLPWHIDARALSRMLGGVPVTLLNDLVTAGLGALEASPSKLAVVHYGRPKTKGGNLAVIAAGTGLGEAAFVWNGDGHVACPTEGAHVDFAPRTPVEAELYAKLAAQYGHVSYERIASGSTINVVYDFFVHDRGVAETPANASAIGAAEDRNVAIVELALRGESVAAMHAIDLWASVYGAEAGNLALKCLANAGVFICGGASARLADVLANGLPARRDATPSTDGARSPFVRAFLDKGRMRPLLERIPIAVVREPFAGLYGAAAHAARAAQPRTAKKTSKRTSKKTPRKKLIRRRRQ